MGANEIQAAQHSSISVYSRQWAVHPQSICVHPLHPRVKAPLQKILSIWNVPIKFGSMRFALGLILLAVVWRIVAVFAPELSNFSPLMALTFCGAVYFRDKRLWLVPFLALSVSDFWIDWHYASVMHYGWSLGDALVRTGCFAAGLGIGLLVARRKNWLTVLGGALGASLLFYFVTNTQAWFGDAFYPKTLAGWWQALTVGHPEYP